MKTPIKILSVIVLIIFNLGIYSGVEASMLKVLVVMSYEKPDKNAWCKEIKEGIDSVLSDTCKIDYFYMNTKINFNGGKQKAKEAYALYKKHMYDGIIAVDDNAQKMFVVPYLKDLVKTPVMFCGVNAEAKKYGYPATNVSGILERGHFRESIALVKQLVPQIETIGFIVRDSPSGKALKIQINNESDTYLAKIGTFELLKTLKDIKANEKLKECNAFFIDSVTGMLNDRGEPLTNKEIIPFINNTFGKPLIGANNSHVEYGALCAVAKTGHEQGDGAANKLMKAMQGTSVSKIPITRNYKGKRVINVTVMKMFGINPNPTALLGATLVRTKE